MDKNQEVQLIADEFSNHSTRLPEVILEERNEVGTLIIFVVVALLAITLLFVVAVFIDCRQEKLSKLEKEHGKPKKKVSKIIPKFLRSIGEDEEAFAEKMQVPDDSISTSSGYNV